MPDESESPKVSPFSQQTPIGRQRVAEAERSMRAHASPWDHRSLAGAVVYLAARELIVQTERGALVLLDPVKELRGPALAVGATISIAESGRYTIERHPERQRSL